MMRQSSRARVEVFAAHIWTFAIVILAGYVIGAKNQATVAILDTS
jgi:hypothetical protein